MADEGGDKGPIDMAIFVFGVVGILIVLWFMTGGPSRADLRGIFLSPLAPVGTGDAYGPTIGSTTPNQ